MVEQQEVRICPFSLFRLRPHYHHVEHTVSSQSEHRTEQPRPLASDDQLGAIAKLLKSFGQQLVVE